MILSFERYTVNKHVTTDVLASPKRWKTTLEPVSERCTMSSCAASRYGDATLPRFLVWLLQTGEEDLIKS